MSARLIPRALLADSLTWAPPRLSPDGRHIAWLAPSDGIRNVWLAPATDPSAGRPLSADRLATVRELYWARNGHQLILLCDETGSEQTRIECLDRESGERRRLSPAGGEARLSVISPHWPDAILLESNARDPALFDLYRADLRSGECQLVLENPGYSWIYADHFLVPRLAESRPDDGRVLFHSLDAGADTSPLIEVPAEDELLTRPFRFYETRHSYTADASEIYALDSRGRDTAALAAWNLASGERRIIAGERHCDVRGFCPDLPGGTIGAFRSEYLLPALTPLSEAWQGELARLRAGCEGMLDVLDQSDDGRRWILADAAPDAPTRYVLHDRDRGQSITLFHDRPQLVGRQLASMDARRVRARDGLDLVCYVTRPAEPVGRPPPGVVLIHGGPWQRDSFALDTWGQFLASRGYAVLNVNFRGSLGLGKAFLNAGDGQWGGPMIDDVLDATAAFSRAGDADPARLAVMGASFGGYASLMALARAPQRFRCGIDLFGVANLESFLQTIPAHWKHLQAFWKRRLGDRSTPAGRRLLAAQSPLSLAGHIQCPVMIAQGGQDPRVVPAESEQIVNALVASHIEVSYLLFPDEGHGFHQPANEQAFLYATEAFLARHLGGRCELPGAVLEQAQLQLVQGGEHIAAFDAVDANPSRGELS